MSDLGIRERAAGKTAARCGAAGVFAALTCTLGCCLPAILVALGVGGSSTAGMAGMNHPNGEPHGALGAALDLLHRVSPSLLIASIILVAGAFALRRPTTVIPALLAGVVLYASVHAQSDPAIMYAGMAVGYVAWLGLFLWTRDRPDSHAEDRRQCQHHDQAPNEMG
ncbi:MAG TPA: hypothetical protein VF299_00950 [Mycobacterium sp.]